MKTELITELTGLKNDPDSIDPAELGSSLIDALISDAVTSNATDIHIQPTSSTTLIRFRIDGWLMDVGEIDDKMKRSLCNSIKARARIDLLEIFAPRSGRFDFGDGTQEFDIRVMVAPSVAGDKIALRLHRADKLRFSIHELGIDEITRTSLLDWLKSASGMCIVCGPTGTGKTSTLYALVTEMQKEKNGLVTLEDPVEYRIEGATQIQVNNKQGLTFASGVKSMLRLDPDYLLVGEIREKESANAAIDAAISGNVLLTTLHSRDAVNAILALRNFGLLDHEISESLRVIIAQRLVRKVCSECAEYNDTPEEVLRWLSAIGQTAPDKVKSAVGCNKCNGTGYSGRTGIFEYLKLTPENLIKIREGESEEEIRQQLIDQKHKFMMDSALEKVSSGETTLREVQSLAIPSVCSSNTILAES